MESKTHPLRRKLILPNEAAGVIRSVMPILEKWWMRDRIVLGGGTALAARWNHRSSTNLDFFIDQTHYKSVYREMREEICECFSSLAKDGELHHPILNSEYLTFTTSYGSISMLATGSVVRRSRVMSRVQEAETQVVLESIEEILAKKLVKRIWETGVFVSRDAYDIVVAAAYEPDALDVARSELLENQRMAICDRFRELSRSGLETRAELIGATHPNIANRAFYFAHEAIEGKYEAILREVFG